MNSIYGKYLLSLTLGFLIVMGAIASSVGLTSNSWTDACGFFFLSIGAGLPTFVIAASLGYLIFAQMYFRLRVSHGVKVLISGLLATLVSAGLTNIALYAVTGASLELVSSIGAALLLLIVGTGLACTGIFWLRTK